MFSLFTRRDNVVTFSDDYKIENFKTDEGQTVCAWSINNVITRETGPAITMEGGGVDAQMWVRDGLLHREDGPAIIIVMNGTTIEKWYAAGAPKNATGGPSIRRTQLGHVSEDWLDENNQLHRDDAPATIMTHGDEITRVWHIHGEPPAEGIVQEKYVGAALTSREYAQPVDGFTHFEYYPDGSIKKKLARNQLICDFGEPAVPDNPDEVIALEYYPDGSIKERTTHVRKEKFSREGTLVYLKEGAGGMNSRQCISTWDELGRPLEEKYYNGFNLHRDDGPAVTTYTKSIRRIWYNRGKITRVETENLPESEWRGLVGVGPAYNNVYNFVRGSDNYTAIDDNTLFAEAGDIVVTEEASLMDMLENAREETAAERRRADELARELAAVRAELEELRLRPGGPDYELAREHFNELSTTQ